MRYKQSFENSVLDQPVSDCYILPDTGHTSHLIFNGGERDTLHYNKMRTYMHTFYENTVDDNSDDSTCLFGGQRPKQKFKTVLKCKKIN